MKKYRILSMSLMLTMLFTLVGCNKGNKGEQQTAEGYESTVVTAYGGDLDTADPYGSTSGQCMFFTNMTFDTLNYTNPDTGEICPELATSWEAVGGDYSVWEIKLVENATFHTGEKFTAEDVKFTFEYIAPSAGNVVKSLAAASYVESMDIVNDYTIRFNLTNAMPDFPSYLETKMYSKNAFETMDAKEAGVIGTGPYYYDKELTKSGVQFACSRYDNYWGGIEEHPTEHIVFKFIADMNTQIAALETGELDLLFTVTPNSYSTLENISDVEVYNRSGASSYYMGFNYARDYMQDLEVRTALAQAINKEDIVSIAFANGIGGTVSENFCVPTGAGYTEVNSIKYNPDEAKATLEAKGITSKKLVVATYSGNIPIAEVLQANLAAVGVDLEVRQVDSANWTSFKSAKKDYDIFLDYCAYQGALMYNYDRFFSSEGSSNVYGYSNAEYDKMEAYVLEGSTYEEMVERFGELQQWVATNLPNIPLVVNTQIAAAKDDVKGLAIAPSNNYIDLSTVYIPARK